MRDKYGDFRLIILYSLGRITFTSWCCLININDIHNYVNVTFNKIRTKFHPLKMNYIAFSRYAIVFSRSKVKAKERITTT